MKKSILFLITILTSSLVLASSTNMPAAATTSQETQTSSAVSNSSDISDTSVIKPASVALGFYKPWARPAANIDGKINNSAIYLTIINDTDNSYNVINASSNIANKVEFHQTFTDEKGVSKMVKVDKIAIPAHTSVELKPGGAHIMLYDLKQDLNVGDKFKTVLFFENSSPKELEVEVSSGN